MKVKIQTNNSQSAPGLLSQAIISNGLIFTSGFIPQTASGEMVNGALKDKFTQVIMNIKNVLFEAGSDLSNIIKVTIYVTDINILKELNDYYKTHFSEPLPAREAVCVASLPLGAEIEMSVIAEV